ncbi:MAG: hypothetical protein ACHP7P_16495, partial [Terriglobales bacterium]
WATGIWKTTQALSYASVLKDKGDFKVFRFSGTDVNQHGMHRGPIRRLALFWGASTDGLPTPLVSG